MNIITARQMRARCGQNEVAEKLLAELDKELRSITTNTRCYRFFSNRMSEPIQEVLLSELRAAGFCVRVREADPSELYLEIKW